MSDATERTSAVAYVKLYASTTIQPTLTDGEVESLVDECQRAATWTAATAYIVGQVIRPTVGNGSFYVCIQAGTSAATEPTWLTQVGSQVEDGSSDPVLIWERSGPATQSIFNRALAVHKAWTIKAARASQLVKIDGQNYQQVFEHCKAMMQETAPLDFN